MGWLKEQWEQIRGNAKWEAVRSVSAVCVTPLVLAIVAWLKHAPWPVWMFLALFTQIAVVLPLYIMNTRKRQREIENRQREINNRPPEKSLNLTLGPHGDNNVDLYLEVMNDADVVRLSATIRILKVSTGQPFKGFSFDGKWTIPATWQQLRNGVQEQLVDEVTIERGKSKRLKVAYISSQVGIGTQEMKLEGMGESILWDAIPRQPQELPYFILRIDLISKTVPKPVSRTFKAGPRTPLGPLQMTEDTV
jgi:hypothetical protein